MSVKLRYYLFLLLYSCGAHVSAAQFNEQSLGKLFTTPAERRMIDAERNGSTPQAVMRSVTPSSIKVNGLIIRSKGKNAVWINGNQTDNAKTIDGVKVISKSVSKKDIRIPVLVDGKSIRVKPGQSWSEDTGSVVDNY